MPLLTVADGTMGQPLIDDAGSTGHGLAILGEPVPVKCGKSPTPGTGIAGHTCGPTPKNGSSMVLSLSGFATSHSDLRSSRRTTAGRFQPTRLTSRSSVTHRRTAVRRPTAWRVADQL